MATFGGELPIVADGAHDARPQAGEIARLDWHVADDFLAPQGRHFAWEFGAPLFHRW
jgi:hypothetical protein